MKDEETKAKKYCIKLPKNKLVLNSRAGGSTKVVLYRCLISWIWLDSLACVGMLMREKKRVCEYI